VHTDEHRQRDRLWSLPLVKSDLMDAIMPFAAGNGVRGAEALGHAASGLQGNLADAPSPYMAWNYICLGW